jgi:chromate transport protein ChrA
VAGEVRRSRSIAEAIEGLALVNVLPGATATQGGLLAGLCFAGPGFVVMLGLAALYGIAGVGPAVQGARYGLGPVGRTRFTAALIRLARSLPGQTAWGR